MSKKDGGAAFPHEPYNVWIGPNGSPEQVAASPGMALRDYFAAAALTGFLASDRRSTSDEDVISESAYKLSDAMLEARKK